VPDGLPPVDEETGVENEAKVADVLGCPVGTVRSRIHRGRALLQELLVDYARRLGYARERVE